MIIELLNLIKSMLEVNLTLSNVIQIGEIPVNDGIYLGCHSSELKSMNGGDSTCRIALELSAINENQLTAISDLDLIIDYLNDLEVYEQPSSYQVYNITANFSEKDNDYPNIHKATVICDIYKN